MSAAPTPVGLGQDFYVPTFEIALLGRELKANIVRDITQVSYTDHLDQIDSFELTVNNWDADKRTYKYSDADNFLPGKTLDLRLGYYGRDRLPLIIRGVITALRPSFPAGGLPSLAISGLNLLHKLRNRQGSHAYHNVTDSAIARQIGGRIDARVITNPAAESVEPVHTYVLQDAEYDIVFLVKRARRLGYDLVVDELSGESVLYFGPSGTQPRPVYRLHYGSTLIEFQPSLNTANQVGSVRLNSWDQENKRQITATARRGDVAVRPVGPPGDQAKIEKSFAYREEILARRAVASQQEGQTLVRETQERIARELITASGSTVGLPDLRAGSLIEVMGVGTRFSGSYVVTSTTHSISSSGYTTRFECKL